MNNIPPLEIYFTLNPDNSSHGPFSLWHIIIPKSIRDSSPFKEHITANKNGSSEITDEPLNKRLFNLLSISQHFVYAFHQFDPLNHNKYSQETPNPEID